MYLKRHIVPNIIHLAVLESTLRALPTSGRSLLLYPLLFCSDSHFRSDPALHIFVHNSLRSELFFHCVIVLPCLVLFWVSREGAGCVCRLRT